MDKNDPDLYISNAEFDAKMSERSRITDTADASPRGVVDPVDERVVNIVASMNRLPDVQTFSSCGGHEDWKSRAFSALPPGRFNVNFEINPTAAGWRSLDLLAWAVGTAKLRKVDDIRLSAWSNSCGEELHDPAEPRLCFEISGRNGVDPDALAQAIDGAASRWAQSRWAQ